MLKNISFRKDHLWLGVILITALFVRLYRLSDAPPGISGDEMFNAIDAAKIHWRNLPLYFEGNNGREALFFYLMAFSTWLLGPTIFALRLPAALLGVGSVLAAYGLGRDAFHRQVGLLAAGLTAVSLWPIMESRWALRAVSLTFLTTLTLFLMMRGWQNGRRRDWLLGGVALGLTMYTYIPSRAFPAVILIWFIWLWWFDRARLHQQATHIVLSLLAALLIFLPYGLYMRQNLEKVNQRISGLSVALDDALQDGEWDKLGESITATLKTFTIQGDTDWRYHLSGQPIFDPITGLFFYAGLALCLWLVFKRDWQQEAGNASATQPSYALVLIWLAAMLGPNLIIDDKPSFLRAAGAIVPIYLITAVSLHNFSTLLSHKWPRLIPLMPRLTIVGLSLILLGSWRSYFGIWSNNSEVRQIYQAELAQISRTIEQNPPPPGTRLFIGRSYAHDLAPQTWNYYSDRSVDWFLPKQTFPLVSDNAWFIVLAEEPAIPDLFAQLPLQTADSIAYTDGQAIATRYNWGGNDGWEVEQTAVNLPFQDAPTLIGYSLPDELYRGDSVTLVSTWQIPPDLPNLPNQLIYIQLELEDESGNIWAKSDRILGYPQESWQHDDTFLQLLQLDIPEGMLPGNSYLRFTLHDGQGNVHNLGNSSGKLGPHLVRSRPLGDFQLQPKMLLFDDTLVLESTAFSTLIAPGLPLNMALNWVAHQRPSVDYQIELQLWLPDGAEPYLVQRSNIWPDVYPPSSWQMNEQVSSFHHFNIPLDIPTTADPQLRLQLLTASGDPVPITQGDNKLADMQLSLRDHLFEAPPISQPLSAQFGDAIQLLGYNLDSGRAKSGGEVHLTLYWQAITRPADHYTVFNHITGADGQIVGQFDGPPSGEAWLTGTWLAGEIIVDERIIPLRSDIADGSYNLIVGLYAADTGQRVPVYVDGQLQANDQLGLVAVSIPSP